MKFHYKQLPESGGVCTAFTREKDLLLLNIVELIAYDRVCLQIRVFVSVHVCVCVHNIPGHLIIVIAPE